MKLHSKALAGSIGLALAVLSWQGHAGTFDQVVSFGDSLSDNGNLSSVPLFKAFFPGQPSLRFTTNPGKTAVEVIASGYGFTLQPSELGGSDYAWGGALVSSDTTELGLVPIPSVQNQIDTYLASTGGHADSHALYTMWIGANDLFSALQANETTAAGTITAQTTARAVIGELQQLQTAGARYVVVFNMPDLSKTPSYNTSAQLQEAQQLAIAYNAQLNSGLSTLNLNVIPVNAYGLLNEIVANPSRFGFVNVTDPACGAGATSLVCGPAGSKLLYTYAAGTQQTYLFADDVHPSTAADAMLGEAVLSELAAPGQISLLGESALAASTAQSNAANKQLLADSLGAPSRFFADVSYARQRLDRSDNSPQTISNNVNLTLGADWRVNDALSAGISLGASRNDSSFEGGGGYRLRDYSALAYANFHADGGAYAGAFVEAGRAHFTDISRDILLGPALLNEHGSTAGSHVGAGVNGGWWFGSSDLKTGPYASVEWQDIHVDSYHESGNDPLAMWYGGQQRKALISALGWRLQGHWMVGDTLLTPFASLAWNHDSKAARDSVRAGLNTMNGAFALPGYLPDRNWGSADVGLSTQFNARFSGWLSYNGRFSDASQRYSSINLGLKIVL